MDYLKEFYKIKNGFTNHTERVSFSMEVHLCDANVPSNECASNSEMELVVKQLFFTMYLLEETIELDSKDNLGKRPTMIKDVFKQ